MTGFKPRPLVLEETTLPTEPHHCPHLTYSFIANSPFIEVRFSDLVLALVTLVDDEAEKEQQR